MLRQWEELPDFMKTEAVRPYYDILDKKRKTLAAKRVFDLFMSTALLVLLSPLMLAIAILVKLDSKGEIFFRQERITQYGRKFRIYKFRTMVTGADKIGSQVTTKNDARITRTGKILRKYRLDELPQLINIILGDMSFVGTRPEVPKYVARYTDEMNATLLLPAGVTSEASIMYKEEERLLDIASDKVETDEIYINSILQDKMQYNLNSINRICLSRELRVMLQTLCAVVK